MFQKGFTLIEIIISIAVIVVLAAVVTNVFLSFDRYQALEKDTAKVASVIERARQLTLFSKHASQYGVHIETSQVTLFKGSTYVVGAPENVLTKLHSKVIISSHSLTGGGDDIVFIRLTGDTDQDGSITFQNKSDASKTETITIEKTGLIK